MTERRPRWREGRRNHGFVCVGSPDLTPSEHPGCYWSEDWKGVLGALCMWWPGTTRLWGKEGCCAERAADMDFNSCSKGFGKQPPEGTFRKETL